MAGDTNQSVSAADGEIGLVTPARRSAGIVVVRNIGGARHCLLLRAFRNWDFPKGLVDQDETPLSAARRETAEETSLTTLAFDWGEAFCETAPYARGKVARYYLARSDDDPVSLPISAELGRPEHHEFRWVPFTDARAMLPPRLLPVIEWAASKIGSP